MTYEHITSLDDPTRPWRKIYKSGDVYVKVYAKRQSRPFGEIGWTVSGSLCDSAGQALVNAEGFRAVLGERMNHEVIVHSDAPAAVSDAYNAGIETIINRVLIAAQHSAIDF